MDISLYAHAAEPYLGYPTDRFRPDRWHLLKNPSIVLVGAGIPERRIGPLRQQLTGHQRSMREPYWMAIGMFARRFHVDDIAYVLDLPTSKIASYVRGSRLYTARRGKEVPNWRLAVTAFVHRGDPEGTRRSYGFLEIERRLLVEATYEVLENGEDLTTIKTEEWKRRWRSANPLVAIPDEELPEDVAERRRYVWTRCRG